MDNYRDEKGIIVSIFVPVFNHEKYIAAALDSILMQKTKYSFEVLVGDDCSTDGTRTILRQYEKKYPGFFTVFYRKHNMYHSKPSNSTDLKMRCKGKYIICLEGDDYWTSSDKLEKQVDFLESHPDYLAVSHKCIMVDENGKALERSYPQCYENEYTIEHFFSDIMPGQTTTLLARNYIKEHIFDTSLILDGHGPGDRRLYFSLINQGRIYCMDETMSAYRYVTNGGSSFSANHHYDFEKLELVSREFLDYAKKNCSEKTILYSEMAYLRELLKGIKMKSESIGGLFRHFKNIDHQIKVIFLLLKQQFNIKIRKKKICP